MKITNLLVSLTLTGLFTYKVYSDRKKMGVIENMFLETGKHIDLYNKLFLKDISQAKNDIQILKAKTR